jgi:hypothetical protein
MKTTTVEKTQCIRKEGRGMNEKRIGRFIVRAELIDDVKIHMATAIKKDVSTELAEAFLARHVPLLAMIVEFDEVETEARRETWERCRWDSG